MPALSNERHERFCRAIVEGKCATDAYIEAGYNARKGARSTASRLLTNANIKARIAEIREKMAQKTEITLEDLITKADYLYTAAAKSGQYAAGVAALKELGILTGKRIERREQGGPGQFERMSDEQLRAFIESDADPESGGEVGALDPRVTPEMRKVAH